MKKLAQEENEDQRKNGYDVLGFFDTSWLVIKKNVRVFTFITSIGVLFNVCISTALLFLIVQRIEDDLSTTLTGVVMTVIISLLASTFIYALQLITYKEVRREKNISLSSILQRSREYILTLYTYVMATIGILIMTVALFGAILPSLLILLIPLGVLAYFNYIFVPNIIFEKKSYGFYERLKKSSQMTKGMYVPLFKFATVTILFSLAVSLVLGIIVSPLQKNSLKVSENTTLVTLSDFKDEQKFKKILREKSKQQLNPSYMFATLIQSIGSGFVSLIVLGALIELYEQRKNKLKAN